MPPISDEKTASESQRGKHIHANPPSAYQSPRHRTGDALAKYDQALALIEPLNRDLQVDDTLIVQSGEESMQDVVARQLEQKAQAESDRVDAGPGIGPVVTDAEMLVLSLMQWMGECPAPWPINSEVGTLADDLEPYARTYPFSYSVEDIPDLSRAIERASRNRRARAWSPGASRSTFSAIGRSRSGSNAACTTPMPPLPRIPVT